jgi:hypothetical protein
LAFLSKISQKNVFLVKNLQIYKVFTPPTGNSTAARILLRFYVTIFGNFKQNRQKKPVFLVKKLQIYKVFTPPTGKSTAARLLLHFYVTIFGNFGPKCQKKFFRRLG